MLLSHQQKFAKDYRGPSLIVHEGGTGKTVCACVWLADGRDKDALVICSKRIIGKWQEALKTWGTRATVVSKEQFKKLPVKQWSAIVIDEADEFASPLFTRQRSQLSTALYILLKDYKAPILLLSATPIRSTPWNLHTLLCFMDVYIDWKKWRDEFFSLEKRPYLQYAAWLPKPNWRQQIRPILEKYADIVLLKDCVDEVPPVTEHTIKIKTDKIEGTFVERHRQEQTLKGKEIIQIGKEYRKILVVAHYVEQVEQLNKELSKDRQTFMVHGGVKGQEDVLKEANETDECFLIVQASLGVGFDADSFSCVVFASISYKVRDWVQMKFRVRRIHNLHPVDYYYLVGGNCDTMVKKTVEAGKDFVPSEWDEPTNTTQDTSEEGS